MGIHYLNNAEFPVLVCGGIIIFYVSAEYCPYPPCQNALEGRNCEISPSIVGEGGGEHETDNHSSQASTQENGVVGYHAHRINGVAIEHI